MNKPDISIDWHTADDAKRLALKLADEVAGILSKKVSLHGAATLVVSGGSTPVDFFRALSEKTLDWQKISVTLADERWVPADNKDSNESLVRKHLMQGPAAAASFVPLFEPEASVEDAQSIVNERLIKLLGSPQASADFTESSDGAVVVLGMGGDGHTASLFPNTDGLAAALAADVGTLCVAMHPPEVEQARMSLTLAALTRGTTLILHVTGDDKRKVLEAAVLAADPLDKPVASLFQQRSPAVYWA